MKKEYIVAIDFGHYETRGWIMPLNIPQQGNALCLELLNKTIGQYIPSRIFVDSSGEFSIDDFTSNPIEELKARVSELKKTKSLSEQEEYQKALAYVKTLVAKGGKNVPVDINPMEVFVQANIDYEGIYRYQYPDRFCVSAWWLCRAG